MSNFPFVDNEVIRENLDQTLLHIVDLISMLESSSFQKEERKLAADSIRKTITIHTGSIIEALLYWKLKKEEDEGKISIKGEWVYKDINILHTIEDTDPKTQVIGAKRHKPPKSIDDLDFNRMIDIAYKKNIITTTDIQKDLHTVRRLRNRVHLARLTENERIVTKSDLNFCFDVARRIKNRLAKIS